MKKFLLLVSLTMAFSSIAFADKTVTGGDVINTQYQNSHNTINRNDIDVNANMNLNDNTAVSGSYSGIDLKNVGNSTNFLGQHQGIQDSGNSTNFLGQHQGIQDSGNSSSGASSNQDQNQNQAQSMDGSGNSYSNSQGGRSDQSQTANNTGNAQNVNFNTRMPHNTPALGSVFSTPTAPCALPVGGGGVGVGFGFNVLTAYINQECVKQETAKLAFSLGKSSTADEVFCSMEHAKETTECMKLNDRVAQIKADYIAQRNGVVTVAQTAPAASIGDSGSAFNKVSKQVEVKEVITDGGTRIRKSQDGGWSRYDDMSGTWIALSM